MLYHYAREGVFDLEVCRKVNDKWVETGRTIKVTKDTPLLLVEVVNEGSADAPLRKGYFLVGEDVVMALFFFTERAHVSEE